MTCGRRAFLASLAAGLALGAGGAAAAVGTPDAPRRWHTGNARLAPLTRFGSQLLFAGDRTLGAISPDRPLPLWSTPHGLAGKAVFRPRAAAGRVVVGGLGGLACWDLDHGRRLWQRSAAVQTGVPLVTGERIYLGDGHAILALDSASGEQLWRHAGVPDTLASYAPAVHGDTVFAGPGDGRLYALSTDDGTPRWVLDRSAEWQYLRQLYISGEVLVAGSYTETLYGISTADGAVLWTFNAGNFINSHHVSGDTAYLWSPTGWLFAIDITSGEVRWRHRTNDYLHTVGHWAPLMAELITAGGRLYALDMGDVLHVLDTASGAEIERLKLPERMRPCVVPVPGRGLAFATGDGDVLLIPA